MSANKTDVLTSALRTLEIISALSGLERGLGSVVQRVVPKNFFRRFDRRNVEIDHHGLLIATHDHTGQWFVGIGVDLLMGHERRYENKIARTRLGEKFEPLAPAHARPAADNINDAFQFAVMVRRGLSVRMNLHCAGPEFIGARHRSIYRCCARHTRSLGSIEIKLATGNNSYAVAAPVRSHDH